MCYNLHKILTARATKWYLILGLVPQQRHQNIHFDHPQKSRKFLNKKGQQLPSSFLTIWTTLKTTMSLVDLAAIRSSLVIWFQIFFFAWFNLQFPIFFFVITAPANTDIPFDKKIHFFRSISCKLKSVNVCVLPCLKVLFPVVQIVLTLKNHLTKLTNFLDACGLLIFAFILGLTDCDSYFGRFYTNGYFENRSFGKIVKRARRLLSKYRFSSFYSFFLEFRKETNFIFDWSKANFTRSPEANKTLFNTFSVFFSAKITWNKHTTLQNSPTQIYQVSQKKWFFFFKR